MLRPALIDALNRRVLLCDGANGTLLRSRGLGYESGCVHWNLDRPEVVLGAHKDYVAAGAELVTTNTFCGSRRSLAYNGFGDRCRELNAAGASLARLAAGPSRWVLGDIASSAGLFDRQCDGASVLLLDDLQEQADALLEGGVDAILVETLTNPEEAAIAVRAARAAGASIVLASFTFKSTPRGYRTLAGATASSATAAVLAEGAAAVGANCGTSLAPSDYERLASELTACAERHPVFLRPNAGSSAPDGHRPQTPEAFAAAAPAWIARGARMLGGCCGTTPEHIAGLRRAVDAANRETAKTTSR